jgi:hypothetical protein
MPEGSICFIYNKTATYGMTIEPQVGSAISTIAACTILKTAEGWVISGYSYIMG